MRPATLAAAVLTLALAPAARADMFHVASSFAAGCSVSQNCKTIGAAITAARSTTGADTIDIAAGTYDEALVFNAAADAGDVLVGAGDTTIITHAAGTPLLLISPATNVTLRSLKVVNPASAPGGSVGINTAISGLALDHVTLLEQSPTGGAALFAQGGTLTADHVTAPAPTAPAWSGDNVSISKTQATIRDSSFDGGPNGTAMRVESAGNALVQRTLLTAGPAEYEVVLVVNAALTLESSLVTGGDEDGVEAWPAAQPTSITLRNDTIEAGASSVALIDGTGTGTVTVDSSVLTHPVTREASTQAHTIACTYSALTTVATSGVACSSGLDGNIAFAPSLIGSDHRLADGSAAIEAGNPAAAGLNESLTDLDGAPRFADFDCDGFARRDMGAFERAGAAGPCPPAAQQQPPPPPPDTVAPALTVTAAARAHLHATHPALRLTAAVDEPATIAAAATIRVAKRTLRLHGSHRLSGAGHTKFSLRLSKSALKVLRRALRAGRKLTAHLTVTAADASGNARTVRRSIRLVT